MKHNLGRFTAIFYLAFFCSFSRINAKIATQEGKPLPEVIEIFESYAKKNKLEAPLQNFEKLNDFAQKHFFIPNKEERLSEKAIAFYKKSLAAFSETDLKKIRELFVKLDDVKEVLPPENIVFDFILIQGSTIATIQKRVQFFGDKFAEGKIKVHKGTQIDFLDGERKLFPGELKSLYANPNIRIRKGWQPSGLEVTDEREANEVIWQQIELPEYLRTLDFHFFHATKQPGEKRATTQACIEKWLHQSKKLEGNALVISSNPFVFYQTQIIEKAARKFGADKLKIYGSGISSDSEVQGYKLDLTLEMGVYLDNLARVIYTYVQ